MNQFKNAWNFYLNHWQYFALLAAPILAIEVVTAIRNIFIYCLRLQKSLSRDNLDSFNVY